MMTIDFPLNWPSRIAHRDQQHGPTTVVRDDAPTARRVFVPGEAPTPGARLDLDGARARVGCFSAPRPPAR